MSWFSFINAAGVLPPPFPPPPTREQVCGITCTSMNSCPPVKTEQYGEFQLWDPIIFCLGESDRQACYAAKKACARASGVTETHCIIPYVRSPGIIYYGAYPYNEAADPQFELNPQGFLSALRELILNGFVPIIAVQSDGPQNTAIAFDQLPGLIQLLKSDPADLTRYCLVFLCWDSVFYGWTDADDVSKYGQLFRQLCPDGYLGMEHNSGHIPLGEGGQDFQPGGRMTYFDTIMSEYDYANNIPPNDTIWQVNGRLTQGYIRPPDQPIDDDPHPPYYLAAGTSRGPYFHCAWEWEGTYYRIRNQGTVDQEAQRRAYMRAQNCRWTG